MTNYESRPVTMDEAHREWHRNVGHPIGTVSCPCDVCDPEMDETPAVGHPGLRPPPAGYVRCGNHAETTRTTGMRFYHASSADVASCYQLRRVHGWSETMLNAAADHIDIRFARITP